MFSFLFSWLIYFCRAATMTHLIKNRNVIPSPRPRLRGRAYLGSRRKTWDLTQTMPAFGATRLDVGACMTIPGSSLFSME